MCAPVWSWRCQLLCQRQQKRSSVSLDRLGLQVQGFRGGWGGAPGVRLVEPFSRPHSTPVGVSFLFWE